MKLTLARALQSQGLGTRKACAQRVRRGDVKVNGEVCLDPETELDPRGLVFTLDDVDWAYRERVYLVLHKPAGYECSRRPTHHPSVYALLPPPLVERGAQCVGRLDQDTTGLLLFTDDGQFQHRMISPKKRVAKHYRAECASPVDDVQLAALRAGVRLDDTPAPVAALVSERCGERCLSLVLAEGKYHQVRRMVAAAGNHVSTLHREALGGFRLPEELPPGGWRWLADDERVLLEQPWPSETF